MNSDDRTRTLLDSGTAKTRKRYFQFVLVMTLIATFLGLASIGPSPLITPRTSSHVGCVSPPAGLVGWWPLDETTGATLVHDLAGFPNDGIPKQAPFSLQG